ncbi:ADAMTS-like protein 4 [Choristoneura fumiferana]|uniref:ADAMTS-like protein 4 n=1 Tax=Choristoneura fumiferana TaxID=7141 RepID=UPI003D158A1F
MVTSCLFAVLIIFVVGRDAVLAGNNLHEMRCGRRLVSGLFSRPRLPLGYSYVTTVPRGACRLNVTEIISSENYIALKITNGSYIMNGEFAVSAPGTYEAAGARFLYSRPAGLDAVFAHGPIQHPIDIMILYTQPNPSIKYEYYTESKGGEIEIESITRSSILEIPSTFSPKHTRRHHSLDYPRVVNVPRFPNTNGISKENFNSEEEFEENIVGDRRFVWKILTYTQCSRSCGGGIQVGKYRCVETSINGDRDVAPIHCTGSSPSSKRRRCGNIPCPPRWRSATWSQCPTCGPATRTRIVGCVQDHSRGITKVSDQKCPSPKPPTTEPCDIPNCSDEVKQIETRRVKRPRDHIDSFHDGPVYSVSVNSTENEIGPEYTFNNAAAGWLFTEWSECVGWCVGGGLQTRSVRCADPSGCAPRKSPEESRTCTPKTSCEPHEGHWFTGQWSSCSSPCNGRQIRGVLCIGGSGRHLRDSACKPPRPEQERACEDQCSPMWYYSEWGQCTGNCSSNVGIQHRTVWCARGAGGASDEECTGVRNKPPAQRSCVPQCAATVPTEFIESQKVSRSDTTSTTTTTTEGTTSTTTQQSESKDCKDKLNNCALAVQARLCHYKYYTHNCCDSCKGR